MQSSLGVSQLLAQHLHLGLGHSGFLQESVAVLHNLIQVGLDHFQVLHIAEALVCRRKELFHFSNKGTLLDSLADEISTLHP